MFLVVHALRPRRSLNAHDANATGECVSLELGTWNMQDIEQLTGSPGLSGWHILFDASSFHLALTEICPDQRNPESHAPAAQACHVSGCVPFLLFGSLSAFWSRKPKGNITYLFGDPCV